MDDAHNNSLQHIRKRLDPDRWLNARSSDLNRWLAVDQGQRIWLMVQPVAPAPRVWREGEVRSF